MGLIGILLGLGLLILLAYRGWSVLLLAPAAALVAAVRCDTSRIRTTLSTITRRPARCQEAGVEHHRRPHPRPLKLGYIPTPLLTH